VDTNRSLQFQKCSQLFIGGHNETLTVAAMCSFLSSIVDDYFLCVHTPLAWKLIALIVVGIIELFMRSHDVHEKHNRQMYSFIHMMRLGT